VHLLAVAVDVRLPSVIMLVVVAVGVFVAVAAVVA